MPNPLFQGFYADPELHFFKGRFWIYPTTSKPYEEQTTFEAFSSPDLVEWRAEGVILDVTRLAWGKGSAAWAPSCAYARGSYWLFFSVGDGDGIGVARSDSPAGPFQDVLARPLVAEYFHGAQPIDAHCFVDDDGSAYLYWGGWGKAVAAPLTEDMVGLGEVREVTPTSPGLAAVAPASGAFSATAEPRYVEGPFMLKRSGIYYFMWSEGSWGDATYNVAWARSSSPFGPFVREGRLFLATPEMGSSAGHHSVLEHEGKYLVAYHRRPPGMTDRNCRVVCIEEMAFDAEGRIMPTPLT
jgi:beta-xylosidase